MQGMPSKCSAGKPAEENASSCCPCVGCQTRPPPWAAQGSTAGAALSAPPAAVQERALHTFEAHNCWRLLRLTQQRDTAYAELTALAPGRSHGCTHRRIGALSVAVSCSRSPARSMMQCMPCARTQKTLACAWAVHQLYRLKPAGGTAFDGCMHWAHTQRSFACACALQHSPESSAKRCGASLLPALVTHTHTCRGALPALQRCSSFPDLSARK